MTIAMTDRARDKALQLAAREGKGKLLRVGVRGGGCSGFSYLMEFVETPRQRDVCFRFGELDVVVDPKSLQLLNGTEIDFENKLMRGGFRFRNPNAKRSCGCGESFA